MAAWLADILDQPERRRTVSLAARRKAEAELGLDLMVDRLLAEYREAGAAGEDRIR